MRTRFLLALLLPLLLLAGCGVRFAYQHLDWLVPWYVSDYVTLDAEQRRLLDARLAERLAWHCRSQLGPYAELLRELDARVRADTPLAPGELEDFLLRGEAFWRELMVAITPDASVLLGSLSDAQVDELAAAFAERNADTRKELLGGTPDERLARRTERMEKRLRTWLGRLHADQRARVAVWSASLVPTTEEWLRNRAKWQGELLAALAGRDQPGFEARLGELLVAPASGWPEAYLAQVARNQALTLDLVADVLKLATPAQRDHLSGEIEAWAGQFESLACAAPGTLARS